jgi:hypothetical protein
METPFEAALSSLRRHNSSLLRVWVAHRPQDNDGALGAKSEGPVVAVLQIGKKKP